MEYYHEHTNTFLSVSEAVVLTDPNFKLLRKLDKKLLDEDFDTDFSWGFEIPHGICIDEGRDDGEISCWRCLNLDVARRFAFEPMYFWDSEWFMILIGLLLPKADGLGGICGWLLTSIKLLIPERLRFGVTIDCMSKGFVKQGLVESISENRKNMFP